LSGDALVLYDTRTRCKRPFVPLEPGSVRMYTCGPTVYAPQHLGNLRSQLFADLLRRALRLEGYAVRHVINITDVGHLTGDSDAGEDKLERAAAQSGRRAVEIAADYTAQWLRDRDRLGCLPPEVLCKATEHIPEQIALVRLLEAKGYSYRIADGIYFDTSKFSRYGEFARLDLAGQAAVRFAGADGHRGAEDEPGDPRADDDEGDGEQACDGHGAASSSVGPAAPRGRRSRAGCARGEGCRRAARKS